MGSTNCHDRARRAPCRAAIVGGVLAALVGGCAEPSHVVAIDVVGAENEFAPVWGGGSVVLWLTAYAIYSDGEIEPLPADAQWVSSNPAIATVEPSSWWPAEASVYGYAPGDVVITVTYGGVSESIPLTVPPP